MLIDLSKDILKPDGFWVRTYWVGHRSQNTKAYTLYNGIRTRCDANGHAGKFRPCYKGCVNHFLDFQDFANWATIQTGYGLAGYELDKDLLSQGGKVYSKETCCFLPKTLNRLLVNSAKDSDVGKGVIRESGKFRVHYRKKSIGLFEDQEMAIDAYKRAKKTHVLDIAEVYKDRIDIRAYRALLHYAETY